MADEKRIRSFEDLIAEEGLLPLARTVNLVGQIADAIAATHADGGAVDALEPRAVLVNEETDAAGRTVTQVLGIVRASDLPVRPGGPRASYTAPEDQGPGGDRGFGELKHQFSLAAIAYEMLAGCPAFPEEIGDSEPAGQGQGHGEAGQGRGWSRPPPPPVSEQVMGVSSGLDQVLRRALSIEPAERYARIEDFMAALREVSDPGAVWDDGATVIWSPAAGDMEPLVPPPTSMMDDYMPPLRPRQRTNTAKIRSLRLTGGAARVMKSAADAISQLVGSVGTVGSVARRRQGRGHDPSLGALMPVSRPETPPGGGVGGPIPAGSASGLSGVTPMAFASFPTSAIPSRRTQVVFLGAAVVVVLAAVAVMSGSRVKPATDSASADNAIAEPEPIRPRPRIVEVRPVARTAPVASKIPSAAATSGSAAIVAVATPTPRHTSKPARAHSRRAGAHRTARR